MTPEPVLSVERLVIEVARTGARVVDDVSLTVGPGEVLGLAGESGCGKTTLSLALLGYTRRGLARRVRPRPRRRPLAAGDERGGIGTRARLAGHLRPAGSRLRRSTPRLGFSTRLGR